MKTKTERITRMLACLVAATTWCASAGDAAKTTRKALEGPVRFAVISDPHLYNPRLGTTGAAFERYLFGGDPKLIAQSEAILDSALARITEAGVRFMIVTVRGQLGSYGENSTAKRAHQQFRPIISRRLPQPPRERAEHHWQPTR